MLSCRRSECLLCSYDAVNVLPCSTWSYLTGGPVLTALPFQDDAQFLTVPQATDLAVPGFLRWR
jgi:hypothetical protein